MALSIEERIKEVILYTAQDIRDYNDMLSKLEEAYQEHTLRHESSTDCHNCSLFQQSILDQQNILKTLHRRLERARTGEVYE